MRTMPVPSAASPRPAPSVAATSSIRARGQGGFTLIELLVVIAILGVLAGVVVFAVGGLRDNSQKVACDTDARVIATAQGAYAVAAGRPGTEAELVAAGYLTDESQYHDVLVGLDSYDLVAVGGCADSGDEGDGDVDELDKLQTGKRIGDPTADESILDPAPNRPGATVPCGVLGPDTGDANQNPAPCDDGSVGQSLDGGLNRLDSGGTSRLRPATDDSSCGPNRICDTDMATETEPGR